jgi:hypothetical protein
VALVTKRHARRAADHHVLTAAGFDEVTALLAWPGVALPEMTLFESRVIPVVEIDEDAHRARVDSGDGPELDSATLTMWEWPETAGWAPSPALSLSGLLLRSTGRRWRHALTEAVRWRGFGPTAVLASGVGAEAELVPVDAMVEFAVYGVGLVAIDPAAEQAAWPVADQGQAADSTGPVPPPARLIAASEPGRSARAGPRRTADRWMEELLYRRAIDLGLYAPTGPRP